MATIQVNAAEAAELLAQCLKVRFGIIEVRVTNDSLTVVRPTHTLVRDDLEKLTAEFEIQGPPDAQGDKPAGV